MAVACLMRGWLVRVEEVPERRGREITRKVQGHILHFGVEKGIYDITRKMRPGVIISIYNDVKFGHDQKWAMVKIKII